MAGLEDVDRLTGCGITSKEGAKLHELARIVPSGLAIVEIGTYKGRSACYMAMGAPDDTRIYTIDVWGSQRLQKARAWQAFREQVRRAGVADKVIPIRGRSNDIGRAWNLPIGLLHIDGDHSFEGCLADYELFGRHIVPGGWIALHDYGLRDYQAGVKRMVDEILQPSGCWECCEVVTSLFTARRKAAS